ncbi:MAG: aminotransferase class IV [Alphaproteobacteria bacterium]|nr:aminotransferase class IV [Alphaproteobacteria bacterium]
MSATPKVYLNGEILDADAARISPFERGFMWGDGIYEVTPCFGGRPYRLEDHIDRLYRSLRYVRIDVGFGPDQMRSETERMLEANGDLLESAPQFRIGHWVTRGGDPFVPAHLAEGPPTVFIYLQKVETGSTVRNLETGVRLSVTTTRRNPPECIETRAKVTSKMNQLLAELDAGARDALSLMLDLDGNVSENSVANFFIARDGVLWTAPERNILEGVTRKVVFELCERLSIPVEERLFTMYDVAQADEFFITSSGVCAMPVSAVDDFLPRHPVPGPLTERLIEAFAADTGLDFRTL